MKVIKQYEMKFFLNTSKSLTKNQVLPLSYTWEITCKFEANGIDTGAIYQKIDEQITQLKANFEKIQHQFTPEEVANELFERLLVQLREDDSALTYLKINSSPMIGYEIWAENRSSET